MSNRKRRTIGAAIGNNETRFGIDDTSYASELQPKRRRDDGFEDTSFLSRMEQDTRRRQSSSISDLVTRRSASLSKPQSSIIRPVISGPAVTCNECGVKLKNQASLNTHRNVVHGEVIRAKIMCPEENCDAKFATMQTFVPHLNVVHGYDLKFIHKTFRTAPDFEFWLENLTCDGSVGFTKSSSTTNAGVYYYCKECGKRDEDTAYCPAHFRATKKGSLIEVYGQLEHVGHDTKPKYVELSSESHVAEKMRTLAENLDVLTDMLNSKIPADFPFESHPIINDLTTNIDLADYHILEAIRHMRTIVPDSPKKRGRKSNIEQEPPVVEVSFQADEDSPDEEMNDESNEEIDEARYQPVILSDGRVQCLPCGVTYKSLISYNAHRNKAHGLAAYKP